MKAQGIFTVSKWDEIQLETSSISRASIIYEITGGITGKFTVEYVMHYTHRDAMDPHNAAATFTGFMVFDGNVAGKKGTFVLEDKGAYTAAGPLSALTIKAGTGTDGFTGIVGSGKYASKDGQMVLELEYTL